MKRAIKRLLSAVLIAVMLMGVVPLNVLNFSVKGSAMDLSSYNVGDIIEFGSYPQSKVTDSTLISKLNNVPKTWISYGYYSGTGNWLNGQMKPSDYMQYTDINYDGNKYRAVTFSQYRPDYTGDVPSEENSHQDDNGYKVNNVYYFRYEPLTWRVLDPSEGYVICNNAIDCQAYQNYICESHGEGYNSNDRTNYASDWATSSLRQWLNNDFYNTAFTDLNKAQIGISHLENKNKHSSKYDGADTYDRIFVITFSDAVNKAYGYNVTSDWVEVSSVPIGAQIVGTKWQYKLRSYTSSSNAVLSGWTKYDTKRTAWGTEQTTYSDPSNGLRNVWTTNEQYISSYTHHWKYYHRYNGSNKWGSRDTAKTWEEHNIDLTYALNYRYSSYGIDWYGTYDCWDGSGGMWIPDGEYDSPNYSNRTLYHYQDPIYTYYYYKDELKETTFGDPSGQANVSNVVKYVKYQNAPRAIKGTDYAKCQGLAVSLFKDSLENSVWWSRVAYGSEQAMDFAYFSWGCTEGGCYVNNTYKGVVPALKFNPKLDHEHQWNDWNVKEAPTEKANGRGERVCSICGAAENIELAFKEDENSKVQLMYPYKPNTTIVVKDETQTISDIIQNGQKTHKLYDITMLKDNQPVQPDGVVNVRIPVPKNFDASRAHVYHLKSRKPLVREEMPSRIEGNDKDGYYIVFKTNHFSYFEITEEVGKVNSVSISNLSLNYKASSTLKPTIKAESNAEYTVKYSSSNTKVATVDKNGKVIATGTGNATITCTVTDSCGNTVKDTCEVTVSYAWWQWIIVIVLFGWIWY